jgi:hypothetical protein
MAPDGQVRLQASGIRLDHSLLSPVSEGEAKCPFAYPELFEPFVFCRCSNAATVCAMDLELNSEGGSGGPTSVCSDQLFDACGAEPVLDLPLTGAWLAGRSLALARSRSSASVFGPGKRFE